MRLLVTLDGSPLSEAVLGQASQMADAARAEVHLLRVCQPRAVRAVHNRDAMEAWKESAWAAAEMEREIPPAPPPVASAGQIQDRLVQEGESYLQDRARRFFDRPVKIQVVFSQRVPETIVGYAREHAIDIIAMATRRRSRLEAGLFGSVARRVAAAHVAPVLLVQPRRGRPRLGALIFDPQGTHIAARCSGPDSAGMCPTAARGPVGCAGRRILAIDQAGFATGSLEVTPLEGACPLALATLAPF